MDFLQLFSLNSFETLLMHRYNDYFIAVKIQVSMLSLTACVSEGKFGALMNKVKEKEDCYTSTLVMPHVMHTQNVGHPACSFLFHHELFS